MIAAPLAAAKEHAAAAPVQPGPLVIAVANQKGGVAKTTTTVSLAGALVHSGHDVLLIDLDAQANLSLALGVDPHQVRGGAAAVLLEGASPAGTSQATALPGLDLLPANAELEMAERFLPLRQGYEMFLSSALRAHLPYDIILLDCPPALGPVTLNALNAAGLLIVPSQPEYFSVHALKSMIPVIRRVRAAANPRLVYRILITMQDRRNRIHRELSEQLRTAFGANLFQTVIETDTKLRESALSALPVTHFRPLARSAAQYQALAEEILPYVQAHQPA